MSKSETPTIIDETFASKGGYEMVSPSIFEKMIEMYAGTSIVVCAIGPSGIGKTAIPSQIAKRRNNGKNVPYVPLYMPTAQQEGFFVPTTAADTKVYFDQRIPRTFQVLLEWATAMESKFGVDKATGKHKVPKNMCPILAVEELNRAVDKSVTRAAFTLIGDRMIGDVKLPDCVQIIATMNPTGGGMSVNEFEKDPAMRRRLLQIGVDYSYGDFMNYATHAKFHPSVLGHLGAQPSHGYDAQAALAGKAFACPATWESVSKACYLFEADGLQLNSTIGRAAVAGAIGTASAAAFLEFVKDHTLVVTPEDVLSSYGPDTETRRRFKAYLTQDGGRLDKITDLSMGLAVRIFANLERKPETITKQLSYYVSDLPEEIMMSFIQRMTDEAGRVGNDAKAYLQTLNQKLAQEAVFVEGLKRLSRAKKAAQDEAATPSPA